MPARPPHSTGKPRLIVVCGPTATGKTALAIELAGSLGGEIVSADSMQVYRHLDIGTAKPTAAERAAAPQHLIDIVEPDEPFDAARYAALARERVNALHRRGRVPVVAGGTGLYIKALLHGLFPGDAGDPEIRRRLAAEAAAAGTPSLHARLAACDPQAAARLHPNDTARVLRALEVFEVTGRPISSFHRTHRFAEEPFEAILIGLDMARERLYERIDRRVEAMFAAGFEEEVRGLLDRGYGPELKPMQSIGYSHLCAMLAGRIGRAEAVRTLKRDTRRFAKRQLTWFRAVPGVIWLPPDAAGEILRRCSDFLSRYPS